MNQSTHSSTKNWTKKWTCKNNSNYILYQIDKCYYISTFDKEIIYINEEYTDDIFEKYGYKLSHYTTEELATIKLEIL